MPQIKAAFKAIKQNKKRYARNQAVFNELKNLTRKFNDLAETKDAQNAKTCLKNLISKINKAKSKGILHKKTASRKISRLSRKAAKLK